MTPERISFIAVNKSLILANGAEDASLGGRKWREK